MRRLRPWVEVHYTDKHGRTVRTWERRVPRPPESLRRSVVFLYPTPHAAENNAQFGGTAFIVGAHGVGPEQWEDRFGSGQWHYYVVTAAHIVWKQGQQAMRINTSGKPLIVPIDEQGWYWYKDELGRPKNDLAVRPID